ncbi:TetR/AcrR family transcriptional regulator C-terminal domain-containing protein [Nocardioides sp. SOB44]|uniref:TetR/AcrR family transcriptional regulator C-terminal domain-containing protein n=1 Tax=Nocardioides cremeus TaxID=3058044 RepID=A0ABT8TRS8_9ACTN|nr:TetR/AcrR family transcriptional regulator C-terminal domain-containing protein [Nocardioides cremeus]MDO3396670.1 TetR/AcrR family transcriptional regulator C-terminal domain-containing protein [Nocardioides cremeus]
MGRSGLTRASIVAAAVGVADAEGVAALSMRSVGKRLGVEAMSLYHHVANKEDLLDGMVDAVFAEFHAPEVGGAWRGEMRARHHSARAVLKKHPWAVGMMDSRRNAGFETLRHHDAVLGCLREAGFSLALTGHAFAVLDAHLYGFLVQELSLAFDGEQDLAELGEQILTALPEGQLPYFREFTLEHALQPGYDFGDEFEVGLELLLDGLAARLEGS